MSKKKEVYIVGGPNGAGKTTFVKQFLPEYANVTNFVNADDIAVGLSPLDRNSKPIKSGKLMLELIEDYINKEQDFGYEATLAGRTQLSMIRRLQGSGYKVIIFFLALKSPELAVTRVKYRVESGGHDIPEETIRRRYARSKHNFWYNYKELADIWYLFENSGQKPELIANKVGVETQIVNNKHFDQFNALLEGK